MTIKTFIVWAALSLSLASVSQAQVLTEDFTGATSSVNATTGQGNWLFSGGACLTAGTSPVSSSLSIPACVIDGVHDVLGTYYNQTHSQYAGDPYLVGGDNGYLGSSNKPSGVQAPDAVGSGALRFTNGYVSGVTTGRGQNGSIVSSSAYSTTGGIQVTFKTVTYHGDSANSSGADGMSFYLLDGCVPLTLNGTAVAVPSGCSSTVTTANQKVYGTSTFPINGAWGGSLAYSCSYANSPADGLVGGYLGLGIDEYGNFLNGSTNTEGTGWSNTTPYGTSGDNTASGGGFKPSRIGLRGAGNISWQALTNAYGTNPNNTAKPYYPSTLTAAQQTAAVQNTCQNGMLYNYKTASSPTTAGATTLPSSSGGNAYNTAGILDYNALAYSVLSGTTSTGATISIANESATKRGGTNGPAPILYNLKITPDGLLSLSYSYNGAAYQSVIKNQSITASNGSLPASVRYGFAGSTGGGSNVHEIMCFKSQPVNVSQSSAGVNQRQSAEIQPNGSAFAYFSFYDTLDWAGRLTANALTATSTGLTVNQTPTWDASCTLTGATAVNCSTGVAVTAQTPSSRVILSYSGTAGVPFEPAGSSGGGITAAQQTNLNLGDPTSDGNRVNYLRGVRTQEVQNATPPCTQYVAPTTGSSPSPGRPCFRARDSVLGDVVDSSPVWVGPPQSPYTATWKDNKYPTPAAPENAGTQNYLAFVTKMQTRTNVVYAGANDGMLHGFRAGAYTTGGVFDTSALNDGQEVLAYVPGALLQSTPSNGSAGCPTTIPNPMAATLSTVQNIHGVSPAITSPSVAACTAPSLDYSNVNYGHNFFVDATPGTGDLFYNNVWHTWLVGGLGPGGAAIYALDITNPAAASTSNPTYPGFAESNASSLVIGEWTPATLSCATQTACGSNLGSTYGTPIIRRLHDGLWGVIFGNGFGSATGDAGIYVMTISATGATSFYYLSTGTGLKTVGTTTTGGGNGIAYVTSADLDGDHITDYVYAGDLKGNVWRFDLTSNLESTWIAATPFNLFNTGTSSQAAQPITTAVTVASGATTAGVNTVVIGFGTGQKTQVTNLTAVTYATAQQYLYGVWDWNLSTWNAGSSVQYASLSASQLTGVSFGGGGQLLERSNLQSQVLQQNPNANGTGSGDVTEVSSSATICWQGTTGCTTGGQFGWYMNLPGTNTDNSTSPATTTYEQVLYSPLVLGNALVVNSTIPAINSTLSCSTNSDTGYTYAVSLLTGNVIPKFFIQYADTQAIAEQTNATGTSFPVTTASGQNWLVYQTVSNTPSTLQVQLGANYVGRRLTWVQLR